MPSDIRTAQFIMACREQQIHELFRAEKNVHQMVMSSGPGCDPNSDEEDCLPYIMQISGNVAIIAIHGKLVTSNSWYNQYMGLLSYDTIRQAYAAAYEHPDVRYILESYDTPGGYVTGMKETADFMNAVGRLKPRYAYVGASAASAGYFLAKNADKIYTSDFGELGSIGVVMVNMEYTDMMKQEGVKAEIIRSGDLKMVGNPYEKLSPKAKAYFQDQVMYSANIFFDEVQQDRRISPEAMDSTGIKSGRTYIGKQAIAVGLADDIDTFDNILALLQKKVDNSNQSFNNGYNSLIVNAKGGEMKKILSQASLEALASGASIDTGQEQPSAEDLLAVEAAKKLAEEEATNKLVEEEAAKMVADSPATDDGIVLLLKEQLLAATSAVKDLEVKLALAEAKIVELDSKAVLSAETSNTIKNITAAAINNMLTALGQPKENFSVASAEDILGRYSAIHETFSTKFPVGGVTPVLHTDPTKAIKNNQTVARSAAVGFDN